MTEQRSSEDVDYDDAANGEMLFNAYREQIHHSQREGLSVGQSSSSMSDRTVQPVVETGPEQNLEQAQIRTLLARLWEQILADCQAENTNSKLIMTEEIYKNFVKRSSRSKKNFTALKQKNAIDEINKLLHEQLLKQIWDLREAHEKSLKEIEELKKFQSSTFDTIARRRLVDARRRSVEDQDTKLELSGRVQEQQNEVNCMSDSKEFQDAESIRSGNSHVTSRPVLFTLIQFLVEC